MFYDAVRNDHGLRFDPFKALLVPRPIGWVTSLDEEGRVNLAPYSFFNAIADKPHYVMFASAGPKDSLRNIEATGEFVCNLATWDLREPMNKTSATVARGVDEMKLAGLTPVPSRLVKPPRVGEAPAAFECRYHTTLHLPGANGSDEHVYAVVTGLVVGIHIDDRFIRDGIVDTGAMRPIARLGYRDYAVVEPHTVFSMDRPDDDS